MRKLLSSYPFWLALLTTLVASWKAHPLSSSAFFPFIWISLYEKGLNKALLYAFASGLFIDFLSSATPLGFYALVFSLILLVLSRLKQSFFFEKWLTLPILSALFSFFFTLLTFMILTLFEGHLKWNFRGLFSDFVFLPAQDALYAFIGFTLPFKTFKRWLKSAPRKTQSLNLKRI